MRIYVKLCFGKVNVKVFENFIIFIG